MSKINPDVKAMWVPALRSDKYKQTRGALRNSEGYCCLGVLCDLQDSSGWQKRTHYGDMHDGSGGIPSESVRAWAGFPRGELPPRVVIDGISERLDTHNDRGRTFAQIADAIEAQL